MALIVPMSAATVLFAAACGETAAPVAHRNGRRHNDDGDADNGCLGYSPTDARDACGNRKGSRRSSEPQAVTKPSMRPRRSDGACPGASMHGHGTNPAINALPRTNGEASAHFGAIGWRCLVVKRIKSADD